MRTRSLHSILLDAYHLVIPPRIDREMTRALRTPHPQFPHALGLPKNYGRNMSERVVEILIARLTYQFNGIMNPSNIEAAWAWITFWADPEPAVAFLEETGYYPPAPATAEDKRIAGNPLYAAAVETTRFGRLPPAFIGSAGWSDNVVLPEFQKVLVGNATPANAVDAMIRGLEQALR